LTYTYMRFFILVFPTQGKAAIVAVIPLFAPRKLIDELACDVDAIHLLDGDVKNIIEGLDNVKNEFARIKKSISDVIGVLYACDIYNWEEIKKNLASALTTSRVQRYFAGSGRDPESTIIDVINNIMQSLDNIDIVEEAPFEVYRNLGILTEMHVHIGDGEYLNAVMHGIAAFNTTVKSESVHRAAEFLSEPSNVACFSSSIKDFKCVIGIRPDKILFGSYISLTSSSKGLQFLLDKANRFVDTIYDIFPYGDVFMALKGPEDQLLTVNVWNNKENAKKGLKAVIQEHFG